MTITTIKLEKQTKDRLDRVKEYKRETYDEILQKMLNILNLCKVNPERARARLTAIDRQKRRQNRQPRIQQRMQKKPVISSQINQNNQRPL